MNPPRFAAVGAGRMGRGIAIAFAYAGHRIALVDLKPRAAEAWRRLADEARAEIRSSLEGLAALGAVDAAQVGPIADRVELVKAGATMGDIVEKLKGLWGTYRETPVF